MGKIVVGATVSLATDGIPFILYPVGQISHSLIAQLFSRGNGPKRRILDTLVANDSTDKVTEQMAFIG